MNQRQYLVNYAYNILARRRYTRKELLHKLAVKNKNSEEPLAEKDLVSIIESFQSSNLINDEEYANLYLLSQSYRKPQGINMIRYKLKNKGLDSQVIKKALMQQPINELGEAGRLVKRVINTGAFQKMPPDKQKATLLRRLSSRGFRLDTALTLLGDKHLWHNDF